MKADFDIIPRFADILQRFPVGIFRLFDTSIDCLSFPTETCTNK